MHSGVGAATNFSRASEGGSTLPAELHSLVGHCQRGGFPLFDFACCAVVITLYKDIRYEYCSCRGHADVSEHLGWT